MAQDGIDLVTGGGGFIGSHLVDRLLADGRRVRVLDNFEVGARRNLDQHKANDRLDVQAGDIRDKDAVRRAMAEVGQVFHLAARADIVPSIVEPRVYFESNVDGTYNMLEAAREHEISRFVYVASSSCYGVPDKYPTPESADIRPQYPYALTKYLGEELALHWAQTYKLPVVSLRFFNVYGPRARTSGTYGAVFGVFLAQLLADKALTIVTAAASDVSGEVFNVGSGAAVSVNRLVELLGARQTVHIPKRPGEPDITLADMTRIRDRLGWTPSVPIEEASRSCSTISIIGATPRSGRRPRSTARRRTCSNTWAMTRAEIPHPAAQKLASAGDMPIFPA
jgi:UDP-glucose 4-epimerase